MSTATTFVRPAGWSYDRRAVTFGRDIFDDAFISLEDLADPLHYRSITERLISAQPSIAPWGAYVAPMNWATWTATAVLLSPALVDGRVLLVDPDQLGVVVNGDPDVERFWARPSECELRVTPTRTVRLLDACLAPVVDAAMVVSGIGRYSLLQLIDDAIVAACEDLRGGVRGGARQRVDEFIDAICQAHHGTPLG